MSGTDRLNTSFEPYAWDADDRIIADGQSYTLTHDGRAVYLRGSPERPVQYLRVIPDGVAKVKHAVDEANR